MRQVCTGVSVVFDDQSVADFFDRQVDAGVAMARCGRLWIHTHPGNSAEPSMTDEQTFARVFGRTDWAVLFILAHGGPSFARLRFHVGPGGDIDLPVRVDYSRPFAASNHAAWEEEYLANVQIAEPSFFSGLDPEVIPHAAVAIDPFDEDWFLRWDRQFQDEVPGFAEGKEARHAV